MMIKSLYKPILTAKQMQKAEQETIKTKGISNLILMEKAGLALSKACHKHKLDGGRIVFIIGSGNNGSDGLVAARLLHLENVPVTAIPLFPLHDLKDDIKHQMQRALDVGVKVRPLTTPSDAAKLEHWLKRAVLVVDAIFGTGLKKPITGWVGQAISIINQSHCPTLSVDIASGIHPDTGETQGVAIQADITLPIAAYKWGHWLKDGKQQGSLMLPPTPIGIHQRTMMEMMKAHPFVAKQSLLNDQSIIREAFPTRPVDAYKQSCGHLWIFGGSKGYTGAPTLVAKGAQSVRTGVISVACPDDVYPIVAAASLETMVHPESIAPWDKHSAIVAGPGWGDGQSKRLQDIMKSTQPLVLDANALNLIAKDANLQTSLKHRKGLTVLTPHPGEAARLLGVSIQNIQADRIQSALHLVQQLNVWVILKGARCVIASPQKHLWINPYGSPNLATAGTGDVLAGVVGGLLAQGISPDIAIDIFPK
ncbi:MAG: NAD(P)H-hydrate dehydratase [Ghiorsea sp.]|nr:NAD(P)H-hydrate dehydratase [Ghiorsea sp.]